MKDGSIGRFITQDPVKGNHMNPQTLNPYVYCLNNPMKYIDPDGRYTSRHIMRDDHERADCWEDYALILLAMGALVAAPFAASGFVISATDAIGGAAASGTSALVEAIKKAGATLLKDSKDFINELGDDITDFLDDPAFYLKQMPIYLQDRLLELLLSDPSNIDTAIQELKDILEEYRDKTDEGGDDGSHDPESNCTSSSDEEDYGSLGGGDHDWIPI